MIFQSTLKHRRNLPDVCYYVIISINANQTFIDLITPFAFITVLYMCPLWDQIYKASRCGDVIVNQNKHWTACLLCHYSWKKVVLCDFYEAEVTAGRPYSCSERSCSDSFTAHQSTGRMIVGSGSCRSPFGDVEWIENSRVSHDVSAPRVALSHQWEHTGRAAFTPGWLHPAAMWSQHCLIQPLETMPGHNNLLTLYRHRQWLCNKV